jgi:hypothetical protein
MNTHRSARLIAWCAFVLGVAASVAANVAHARPELGPRLSSAFAPVALLLTVEIMSRVPWPQGTWWTLGRYGGTGTVALVAAVMSYRHMYGLLATYGEDTLNASIGPLAVDGLMVVASLALLALGQHHQAEKPAPAPADSTRPAPVEAPTPAVPAPADHAPATDTIPAPVSDSPIPEPARAPVRSVMPIPAGTFARPNGTGGSR